MGKNKGFKFSLKDIKKFKDLLPKLKELGENALKEFKPALGNLNNIELSDIFSCRNCGQFSPVFIARYNEGVIVYCIMCGTFETVISNNVDIEVFNGCGVIASRKSEDFINNLIGGLRNGKNRP